MKMLKVEYLFSITAVGSLKEELKPGELVIPDQYFDMTFKREKTFFENGIVAHVSMADPTCRPLSQMAYRLAKESGLTAHLGGTYCNMEGPQFSSRAESLAYRQLGFSLIGMTQAVEAKLARELEMCFLPLALVTDYDCWHQSAGIGHRGNGHRQSEQSDRRRQKTAAADHRRHPGKKRIMRLRQRPGHIDHHRAAHDPGKNL